jgi:UDPglucose 6-dehydrogenase
LKDVIGFIGLGKLGLPCAAAMSVSANVKVVGYDINPAIGEYIRSSHVPYLEDQCDEYLSQADIEFTQNLDDVVSRASMIFLAVQTPHEPRFEGVTPVPDDLSDFSYAHLESAIDALADSLRRYPEKKVLISVISTVLPGTMRTLVLPKIQEFEGRVTFCYNPYFIAMGTTISDFLNPEFVLIGSDDSLSAKKLEAFYSHIHNSPCSIMKIESAELAKVAYNTFIGFKIVFANSLSEITQVRGGDVDEITNALAGANVRLMSGKYMSAGMGDGGGCHPRDQIAMSWLARETNLSADIFGWLAKARDAQTKKQAQLIIEKASETGLAPVILGESYKPDINLTVGSPSKLLQSFLFESGQDFSVYDPFVYPESELTEEPALFFVATNHKIFKSLELPSGSIVIDPWGNATKKSDGVQTIRPGRHS